MGLKDRVLDVVAKLFSPTMDHPSRGGMTGDGDDDGAEDGAGSDGGSDAGAGTETHAEENGSEQ